MIVKLLTEHHLECLSLEGNYRGSSESTHVKMPHLLEISRTGSNVKIFRGRTLGNDNVIKKK